MTSVRMIDVEELAAVLIRLRQLCRRIRQPGEDEFRQGYEAAIKDTADAFDVDLSTSWAGPGFTKHNEESAKP
jgi:hypothetical protein